MKKNIIKRLFVGVATLTLLFGVFKLGVHAANSGWLGSENNANTNDNLTRITVLIDDLKDSSNDKDNTIQEIEKLLEQTEKELERVNGLYEHTLAENKQLKNMLEETQRIHKEEIDELEGQLDQAYEEAKQIESRTDDMVEELEE